MENITTTWRTAPVAGWNGPQDDRELIEQALKKEHFRHLWEARESKIADCGSVKEAVFAIIRELAVLTGYDHQRILALTQHAKVFKDAVGSDKELTVEDLKHLIVATSAPKPRGGSKSNASLDNFYAYGPLHQYIFLPTRELWPATSVNSRIPPLRTNTGKKIKASDWLDNNRSIEQMVWAPGSPMVIKDSLISEGQWSKAPGFNTFNIYVAPKPVEGDPTKAGKWIDHIKRIYPREADHIIKWLAHRVQKPEEKINHALVLGGDQGIGKDTFLEPVKRGVGHWNFKEIMPTAILGQFNSWVKSVILRINEARDLGEFDRYSFYDRMKIYTAAPPDVLPCNEKNIREHSVMNVMGVIYTTNHKSNGIYIPGDDRRHHVSWSNVKKEDLGEDYFKDIWSWYLKQGGIGHVVAYLKSLDLSDFNAKAPPPRTEAWRDIVDANRSPEDAELSDLIEVLRTPTALTLSQLASAAGDTFKYWLEDRRNRRQIPHRLEAAGYAPIRNPNAADGLWKIGGKRQVVYAGIELCDRDRLEAAATLAGTAPEALERSLELN